jgi:hypothetical protein
MLARQRLNLNRVPQHSLACPGAQGMRRPGGERGAAADADWTHVLVACQRGQVSGGAAAAAPALHGGDGVDVAMCSLLCTLSRDWTPRGRPQQLAGRRCPAVVRGRREPLCARRRGSRTLISRDCCTEMACMLVPRYCCLRPTTEKTITERNTGLPKKWTTAEEAVRHLWALITDAPH